MKRYITKEEYIFYGGKYDVTETNIDTYNLQFASKIHPNGYMLEDFYNQPITDSQGNTAPLNKYPYEVKLAMVAYIDFMISNDSILNNLPIGGSTVGSTSIDYVNSNADNFGKSRFRIPGSVREILLSTNLLNQTSRVRSRRNVNGRRAPIKFIGTIPYDIPTPAIMGDVQSENKLLNPSEAGSRLHSMEEITANLPSITCTLFKEEYVMDGAIVTEEREYVLLNKFKGWVRGREYNDSYSAVLIASPVDLEGNIVKIHESDRIEYTYGDEDKKYTVVGIETHLDYNGKLHHTFVFLD